ncbi:MAG: RDD family protein [Chitinophagaceae bacterium]|nr:RDD family protein [Chitinophagaceae bacterium]
MATISITTAQNIELDYELASVGERMLACLIDLLIFVGYSIITFLLMNTINYSGFQWLSLLLFLPIVFYSLLSEVLMNGQTVGKKVMGIKVISLTGEQASLGQYMIRWLFRILDLWISFFVLAVIIIAASEKHQRLGDIIAGTTLVKTKPRTAFAQTLYTPVLQTNYVATYPEVIHLSDSDIQLVKEVLINVQKSGNTMLALQAMNKIEQTLNIMSQHEPVTFLYAVMSDYNHLASKL